MRQYIFSCAGIQPTTCQSAEERSRSDQARTSLTAIEGNTWALLIGIVEVEGVACKKDGVAVDIVGDRRAMGGSEAVEYFTLRLVRLL